MTAKRSSISQADLSMIQQIYTMMGEVKGIVEIVQEQTEENTRTLRGYNGTPGLLVQFSNLESQVSNVDRKIEDVKATIKDVPAAIADWKRYPSLTWMIRHKFKEMSIITAITVALAVFIGFPGTYVAERLQFAIELLFAKWLKL